VEFNSCIDAIVLLITMYGFTMAYIEFHVTGQNSVTPKSKDLASRGFQKNSKSQAQFQKGQPPPCKTTYAFHRSSLARLGSFGHKSTPSERNATTAAHSNYICPFDHFQTFHAFTSLRPGE